MEALIDLGERELAQKAMEKVAKIQKKDGAVPAYYNVDWICSTGLFQFALVWYKLGQNERANQAFDFAASLQNPSGGWYGGYPCQDWIAKCRNKNEPDYFPHAEPSWVVKYFLGSLAVGVVLVTINLMTSGLYTAWLSAFRDAAFQMTAMASTTGFASSSNALWPSFAVLLSFFYMIQCGCIGSTSGGLKADRVLIFYKAFVANVRKTLHPNAVIPVRLRGVALDEELVASTTLFIGLYILTFFITALLLLFTGLDLTTGISAAASSLGNVGPGFGEIYTLGTYAEFSVMAKVVCTITMLFGRLEIYGILMLFYYRYWR